MSSHFEHQGSGAGREEPRRQPPNPADLRRHPPQGETCLRIRGLVRDYADDELEGPLRAAVELHVHDCRQCALALARAEHEVLWLRRVARAEPEPQLKRTFAADTVQRLLRDLGRETTSGLRLPPPAAAAETPPLQVAPRARTPRGHRVLFWSLLGAAMALLSAVGLFAGLGEMEQSNCLVAAHVLDVYDESGTLLRHGATLDVGSTVRTGRDGNGAFEFRDREQRRRGTLQLNGDTTLRLGESGPVLVQGSVEVDAREQMALALADGTRIELDGGRYYIDASDYRAHDGPLDGRLGNRPRVRVEVVAGEARIARNGTETELAVHSQQVASFGGFGPVDIAAVPSDAELSNRLFPGPRDVQPVPAEEHALVGEVFERLMGAPRPAAGAQVTSYFWRGNMRTTCVTQVDANGFFRVDPQYAFRSDFVVLLVQPPPGRSDLGWQFIDARPVLRTGGQPRLPEPLVLTPSMAIQGDVTDGEQAPLLGVRVVPCVVDELFGLLMPLVDSVSTDESGAFTLQQLPTSLGPHQQLGVLLLHPDRASRYCAIPLPGSLGARAGRLSLTMEALRQVQLQLPPGNRSVEVLEELVDAPAGTAVLSYRVQPAVTPVALACGRGRLWLRRGGALLPLRPATDPQFGSVYRPEEGGASVALRQPLCTMPGAGAFQLVPEFRHMHIEPAAGPPVQLAVVHEDSRRSEPRAQVFAVGTAADGQRTVRFLGLTDYAGELPAALLDSEHEVVAVGVGGGLAHRTVSDNAAGSTLLLQRCGTVLVGPALRPPQGSQHQLLAVRFEPAAGMAQAGPFVRHTTAAEGWIVDRLPPGDYTLQIGNRRLPVTVAADVQVELR